MDVPDSELLTTDGNNNGVKGLDPVLQKDDLLPSSEGEVTSFITYLRR